MSQGLEAITLSALSSALDVAALRQQVIASNIANVNTPGYAARRVSFAAVLQDQQATSGADPARVEPVLDQSGQPRPVQLDQEVAAMAQNALQYQALLRGVNRHFSILASAVSEGKR